MENFNNHASYSIVEKTNSEWVVQNIKVPYDYQRAVNEIHTTTLAEAQPVSLRSGANGRTRKKTDGIR